nr:unnamed protein product [Digitaria exilis]
MGQCMSWALGLLVPSLWEAEVAISATALLIAALILFLLTSDQRAATKPTAASAGDDSSASSSPHSSATRHHHRDAGRSGARGRAVSEITCAPGAGCYIIKLELLSAKYLIGANLDGSSDPFAVISCGEQKRFSSMVPSPRNPLWGEEFNFLVDQLPVEVTITIYDWDTVCKCKVIGSVTIAVLSEDETGASWYELDSKFGQVDMEHLGHAVKMKFFPGTPEKFFSTILGDNSMFFQQYRDARKDTDFKLSKWYTSEEYGGKVREVTFRSQCHSPLCPPDTAVTEWQHASFSKDKRNLIYETKHQAHDVPFGSYFEYRREVCKILEAGCDYFLKSESNSHDSDEIVMASSP